MNDLHSQPTIRTTYQIVRREVIRGEQKFFPVIRDGKTIPSFSHQEAAEAEAARLMQETGEEYRVMSCRVYVSS